jgi:hypothetical protein
MAGQARSISQSHRPVRCGPQTRTRLTPRSRRRTRRRTAAGCPRPQAPGPAPIRAAPRSSRPRLGYIIVFTARGQVGQHADRFAHGRMDRQAAYCRRCRPAATAGVRGHRRAAGNRSAAGPPTACDERHPQPACLDDGQPLTALVHAMLAAGGITSFTQRPRQAWAAVGVDCNDLGDDRQEFNLTIGKRIITHGASSVSIHGVLA